MIAHTLPNVYKIFLSVCAGKVILVITVAPAAIPTANPVLVAMPITITANIILKKSIFL